MGTKAWGPWVYGRRKENSAKKSKPNFAARAFEPIYEHRLAQKGNVPTALLMIDHFQTCVVQRTAMDEFTERKWIPRACNWLRIL